MGSAVAECLAEHYPVPLERVAVDNSFGESGQPQELMDKYHLNAETIVESVRKVLYRKA
jgi:transketolase